MEFENLLTLIKTVSESELTSFTMKDGDLKISMGKEKQVVVEQTGMQVMPAVAGNAVDRLHPGCEIQTVPVSVLFVKVPASVVPFSISDSCPMRQTVHPEAVLPDSVPVLLQVRFAVSDHRRADPDISFPAPEALPDPAARLRMEHFTQQ